MQAIILAAGMGRRLGDLTENNTKCMIEIVGTTLIERVLLQLSQLNLSKIIIVVGYKGNHLKKYVGDSINKIPIEYIENEIYEKTNNIYSLWLASGCLKVDDTLLLESDLILDDTILSQLEQNPYPNLVAVAPFESWMDGTVVNIDEGNNITDLFSKERLDYNHTAAYYKTINVYKFSKEFAENYFVPFLDAYTKALGNNEYYEQVLRVIVMLDKSKIRALPMLKEKWYEIDDIQDLDIAETIFAEPKMKTELYHKRFGGFWRFPEMIDFCYLVNPFFPPLKMKEELRANFDILLSEYPSGSNVNRLLAAKYFNVSKDKILVGNGAAELISSLCSLLEGRIGVIFPTFEEYVNRIEMDRIEPYYSFALSFCYTAKDVMEYFKDKNIQSLLFVNPDNPSGNYISFKDLLQLIEWAKIKGIKIVIDESFVDFAIDGLDSSLLNDSILDRYKNLIVIKSISKSYGVPGLRLGILASSDRYILNRIQSEISIWNINSFAEFYMQIFGKYENLYKEACIKFVEEREQFLEKLKEISFLNIFPSQANYFLCEISEKYTSKILADILLNNYNILIKDCSSKRGFYGGNYIRIAVRDRKDNDKLIDALMELSV